MKENSLKESTSVDEYIQIAKLLRRKKINIYAFILIYVVLTIVSIIIV